MLRSHPGEPAVQPTRPPMAAISADRDQVVSATNCRSWQAACGSRTLGGGLSQCAGRGAWMRWAAPRHLGRARRRTRIARGRKIGSERWVGTALPETEQSSQNQGSNGKGITVRRRLGSMSGFRFAAEVWLHATPKTPARSKRLNSPSAS